MSEYHLTPPREREGRDRERRERREEKEESAGANTT
jgi:hypothetical protein